MFVFVLDYLQTNQFFICKSVVFVAKNDMMGFKNKKENIYFVQCVFFLFLYSSQINFFFTSQYLYPHINLHSAQNMFFSRKDLLSKWMTEWLCLTGRLTILMLMMMGCTDDERCTFIYASVCFIRLSHTFFVSFWSFEQNIWMLVWNVIFLMCFFVVV